MQTSFESIFDVQFGFCELLCLRQGLCEFGDLNRGPLFLVYLYFSPKKPKSIFIIIFFN